MKKTIDLIKPFNLIYMRQVGAYGENNAQLMQKFIGWVDEKKLWRESSVIIGIAQDNPATTDPEECRYDVGMILPDDTEFDEAWDMDDVFIQEVTGGKYAVFEMEHTAEAIQKAWLEMFVELAQEGFEIDPGRSIMERYSMEKINKHLCEICVPVI